MLYDDLMIFTAGGPDALTQILADPTAVVISQGMAEGLAVPLGGTIKVQGEGLDHEEELTVVGIAQRLPGFSEVGRIRNQALNGGTVFISLDGFRRVTTNPREALPDPDDPVLDRVLATVSAGADPSAVEVNLHEAFNRDYDFWTRLAEVELERARASRVAEQALLLVLTLLSFVTAVFGVFAVIYVTIYARRREIGMMKAVGARNWELNGILCVESIAIALECGHSRHPGRIGNGLSAGFCFECCRTATAAIRHRHHGDALYRHHGHAGLDPGDRVLGSAHCQAPSGRDLANELRGRYA